MSPMWLARLLCSARWRKQLGPQGPGHSTTSSEENHTPNHMPESKTVLFSVLDLQTNQGTKQQVLDIKVIISIV